jgi:hypothetical protein
MFAKLAYMLGDGLADMKAAGDHLHSQFGTRDPLALNDRQAELFAKSVREKYGAFRAKASPSDHDRQPLVPSTDGSRKAKLDPVAIYAKYNRVKAGVAIKKFSDDE